MGWGSALGALSIGLNYFGQRKANKTQDKLRRAELKLRREGIGLDRQDITLSKKGLDLNREALGLNFEDALLQNLLGDINFDSLGNDFERTKLAFAISQKNNESQQLSFRSRDIGYDQSIDAIEFSIKQEQGKIVELRDEKERTEASIIAKAAASGVLATTGSAAIAARKAGARVDTQIKRAEERISYDKQRIKRTKQQQRINVSQKDIAKNINAINEDIFKTREDDWGNQIKINDVRGEKFGLVKEEFILKDKEIDLSEKGLDLNLARLALEERGIDLGVLTSSKIRDINNQAAGLSAIGGLIRNYYG